MINNREQLEKDIKTAIEIIELIAENESEKAILKNFKLDNRDALDILVHHIDILQRVDSYDLPEFFNYIEGEGEGNSEEVYKLAGDGGPDDVLVMSYLCLRLNSHPKNNKYRFHFTKTYGGLTLWRSLR